MVKALTISIIGRWLCQVCMLWHFVSPFSQSLQGEEYYTTGKASVWQLESLLRGKEGSMEKNTSGSPSHGILHQRATQRKEPSTSTPDHAFLPWVHLTKVQTQR